MVTITWLRDFIFDYYINPIIHDTGYNPVNTLTWALILAPLCLILVLKLLRRFRVAIDEAFIAAVSPYILLGAVLRVIEDAELISPPISYMLISPLIYLLLIMYVISLLLITYKLCHRRYKLVFASIGLISLIATLVIITVFNHVHEHLWLPWVIPAVIGISGTITSIIYVVGTKLHLHFLHSRLSLAALGAHMLDAASSYIGIDLLGYHGKHVLENLIVSHTGTAAGMFILKLGILIPGLYILDTQLGDDRDSDRDTELRNILLLAIIIVGLGPAARNTLRIALGI